VYCTLIEKRQHHCSVVYGFISFSTKRDSAKLLLALNRGHRSIENRSHLRRDVILGEDFSQARTGRAPEVLAALNNSLLALMDFLRVPNVPNHMSLYQAHPLEALRLLLLKL
jgi:hypothetical protein